MQSPALPSVIAGLQLTAHGQGKSLWYAVKSHEGRFLRLGRSEYLIASALDGRRTATEVAIAVREIEPQLVIAEEEVLKVTSWLAAQGVVAAAPGAMQRDKPKGGFSFNPVYTKIPLLPGRFLEKIGAWLTPLVCGSSMGLAGIVSLFAGLSVVLNWDRFASTTSNLFVADSYLLWGVAWILLKTAHELGHAVMAVKVGSHIRSAGVSLIFMAPIPYVDLSDLWAIPNRWHRILCCAGGMLVEVVIASIAVLVALSTENQSLQYFCCAIATMGTVTTLAFNASPLMRFDGYFILSDLIDRPNLYAESQLAARQFVRKCIRPWQPSQNKMTFGLVVYGIACYQYRMVVLLTMAIGTILAFQGLGLALVAWGAYVVFIGPQLRARAERASRPKSPAVDAEPIAWGVSKQVDRFWGWAFAGLLCLLFFLIPSPIQPSTPGYIALREPSYLRSESEGFLSKVLVEQECSVEPGQLIAVLSNPELELELALKRSEVAITQEAISLKRAQGNIAQLQARQAKLDSLRLQMAQLEKKVSGLEIHSPVRGTLHQNDLQRRLGLFIKAGDPLALIAKLDEYEVVASAHQQDVKKMRGLIGQTLQANVSGGQILQAVLEKVDPRASDRLREPLLAAPYGGPLAVQMLKADDGTEDLKMLQPRFDMRLRLSAEDAANLKPGQLVRLRIPGESSNLISALRNWFKRKWDDLNQYSQNKWS